MQETGCHALSSVVLKTTTHVGGYYTREMRRVYLNSIGMVQWKLGGFGILEEGYHLLPCMQTTTAIGPHVSLIPEGKTNGPMETPLDPGSGGPPRPLLLALELPGVSPQRAAELAAERCALHLGDGCLRRRRLGSGHTEVFFFWGWENMGKPNRKKGSI